MHVIVLASACRSGGALSIYRQFLSYLSTTIEINDFTLIIDFSMPHPKMRRVTYIFNHSHSWAYRLFLGQFSMRKILIKAKPDIIVSLQNIGYNVGLPQIIYYHNIIPLMNGSWNPFLPSEFKLFLYNKFYFSFVTHSLNKKTKVVVQAPFVKTLFCEKSSISESCVYVMRPDAPNIDVDGIQAFKFAPGLIHLLYPATAWKYKNHRCLIDILQVLKSRNDDLFNRIRIHLTLTPDDLPSFYKAVIKLEMKAQFVFDGIVEHAKLLEMYKASSGIIFPSSIETVGLPLLEASKFGLPILVSNLPYAHDALGSYEGAFFIELGDYDRWAIVVEQISRGKRILSDRSLVSLNQSSWPDFFHLINQVTE